MPEMDQLSVLKKMSGEKRLEQAFMLSDFIHELNTLGEVEKKSVGKLTVIKNKKTRHKTIS